MRVSHLILYFLIALFLLAGEFVLETRASTRGFTTLVWGSPSRSGDVDSGNSPVVYGRTDTFPFRSRVYPKQKRARVARVWVASSSYAEDVAFPPNRIFPTLLEDSLEHSYHLPVEVFNAGRTGFTITANTRELAELGPLWRPDVVVLYQMTNDLGRLSRRFLGNGKPDRTLSSTPLKQTALNPAEFVGRLYESTTLFAQLSANVTPWISQYRLLSDHLPPEADTAFAHSIYTFVAQARDLGALPVLATFAPSHMPSMPLPRSRRFWILRWAPDISPKGYLLTIQRWNAIIRQSGRELDVPVIDMAAAVGGQAEFYRDLAHLTARGHAVFASQLARELAPVVDSVERSR